MGHGGAVPMVLPPHQLAGDAAHGHVGDHGLVVGSKLDLQLVEQLVKVWNGKTEPLLHD